MVRKEGAIALRCAAPKDVRVDNAAPRTPDLATIAADQARLGEVARTVEVPELLAVREAEVGARGQPDAVELRPALPGRGSIILITGLRSETAQLGV